MCCIDLAVVRNLLLPAATSMTVIRIMTNKMGSKFVSALRKARQVCGFAERGELGATQAPRMCFSVLGDFGQTRLTPQQLEPYFQNLKREDEDGNTVSLRELLAAKQSNSITYRGTSCVRLA